MLGQSIRWFQQIGDDPALASAQAVRVQRQVPLLYGLLLINSIAIAWSHSGSAPRTLTFSIPLVLCGAAVFRLVHWLRVAPDPTPTEARRQLRTLTALAAVFGVAYTAWSLALARYGGPYEQAHIAIYASTTVIGCIFCLIHLPQAAVVVVSCMLPSFVLAFFGLQELASVPIAVNLLLVVMVLLRVLLDMFGSFRREVSTSRELAEQHNRLERLSADNRALAFTDSLTGLPNRRSFYEALGAATQDGRDAAVGIIDLDRFKPVNDTFGHQVGDRLLSAMAMRLRETAAPLATLYRIGGDEFGLILDAADADVERLGDRLCQTAAVPVMIDERLISVTASIGLAAATRGMHAEDLADRADRALYHAKAHKPGTAVVFTEALEDEARVERLIEVELRALDAERDLEVHVQPIVEGRSGAIVTGEVLVRWTCPSLGSVSPDRFIAVAERSSLIHKITLVVVGKALDILARIPSCISLSVNVSACDLNCPATIAEIIARVERSGIDPGRLWIEVTETAAMRDLDGAIDALNTLRGAGMRVALDDFGTGYSSLSALHRLPLDRVKIDRSFASSLSDEYSVSISRAVVGLCKTLHLSCVGEGVETTLQASLLQAMGCDLLQGYLFHRPQPAERFVAIAGPRRDASLRLCG